MYKSNARHLDPIRQCEPEIEDKELRRMAEVFASSESIIQMDRTFEHSLPEHVDENVALFNLFKRLRNARLLQTTKGEDLYYAAMRNGSVQLTRLGRFYWELVKKDRI